MEHTERITMNWMEQALLGQTGRPMDGLRMQDLNDLCSIFTRNTSHELRTPLAKILGYAELLREGYLGALAPEQQRAAGVITDCAYELRKVIDRIDILLTAKSQRIVTMPLVLAEVVAKVLEERHSAAEQAGIAMDFSAVPGVPTVLGDPQHLQQAVDCIVENALKFTPGGGRVTLQVYAEPGWTCLAVADTGVGIPAEELERIFIAFYQVDGSTTRKYSGVGLGLTVARTVVAKHGGQIVVESQPGQGSRFIIKLPALSVDAHVEASLTSIQLAELALQSPVRLGPRGDGRRKNS
jgi:signal transduction histidine kinase